MKHKISALFLTILFVLSLLMAVNTAAQNLDFATDNIKKWNYKGISLTGYYHNAFNNEYIYKEIDYFKALGFNSIELVPTWYQDTFSSNTIYQNPEKTIDDRDIEQVIQYIKKQGMKVNLKPHVDPFPKIVPKIKTSDLSGIMDKITEKKDKELIRNCYNYNDKNQAQEEDVSILSENLDDKDKEECGQILKNKGFLAWRAKINPTDPNKWFESYNEFLNHYLAIAIKDDVDIFTIGTEMVSMTRPQYLQKWKKIVAELRSSKYKGKLVYTAHEHEIFGVSDFQIGDRWIKNNNVNNLTILPIYHEKINPQEKQSVRDFWNLFDYLSMTVYFELGDVKEIEKSAILPKDKNGDINQLIEQWQKKAEDLQKWKKALDLEQKKVIFGELGYRSIDYGHYKPYLPDVPIFDNLKSKDKYNEENQRNCYDAMFKTLNNIDWLDGIFFWEEQIKIPPLYSNTQNTGYSIIGKPTANLISSIYLQKTSAIQFPKVNHNLILGDWYYYDDHPKGGTSQLIFNGKTNAKNQNTTFRYIIKNLNKQMKQVAQLSGRVTTNYQYGYIGMGLDFSSNSEHEDTLQKVRKAKGIKFKTRGDGKKYRCRLELSNMEKLREPWKYNYHGKNFRARDSISQVTIMFNNPSDYQQENWGNQTQIRRFSPSLIKKISFQTVGQPHPKICLQIWDLEIIH